MKNSKHRVSTVLDHLATRRAERQAHAQLASELAGFDSPADLLELDMILSRYPDEQTDELRTILGQQALGQLSMAQQSMGQSSLGRLSVQAA